MSTQRDSRAVAVTASCYDDMPFSQLLFRYLWPFWLFRDASRGDFMSRAAAYRHNQSMRIYLPGYLMKWALGSGLLLLLTMAFDAGAEEISALSHYFLWMAAGSGMAFAFTLCMLLEMTFVYFYLSRHDF